MGRGVEQLATHLKHAEGSDWFDPIPLGANLTQRLSSGSDESIRLYMHEYTHFLQSATTFFGANRMHTFLRCISDLSKELKKCQGQLALLNVEQLIISTAQKLDGLDAIAKEDILGKIENPWIEEESICGFEIVNINGTNFPIFGRANGNAESVLTPINITAIEESMAMAVECWLAPETANSVYKTASDIRNWEWFQYAVVRETIASTCPHWDSHSVIWMTVVICDISLNHYLPMHAFSLLVGHIEKQWRKSIPELSKLKEIYVELERVCSIEDAENERKKLNQELVTVSSRPNENSAPFDWYFANYLKVYLQGYEARSKMPHVFVDRLLNPNSTCADEILIFESIPYYTTQGELISTRTDDELITAGLALICLQDFLKCLIDSKEKNSYSSVCPLLDRPGTCSLEKGEHCKTQPWLAPVVNNESCVYRFATDALGVVS